MENALGWFAVSYIKRPSRLDCIASACAFLRCYFFSTRAKSIKFALLKHTGRRGAIWVKLARASASELCRMRDIGVDISHVTSLKSHEPSVHGTLVFNGTKRIFSDPYQLSNFTAVEFLLRKRPQSPFASMVLKNRIRIEKLTDSVSTLKKTALSLCLNSRQIFRMFTCQKIPVVGPKCFIILWWRGQFPALPKW